MNNLRELVNAVRNIVIDAIRTELDPHGNTLTIAIHEIIADGISFEVVAVRRGGIEIKKGTTTHEYIPFTNVAIESLIKIHDKITSLNVKPYKL